MSTVLFCLVSGAVFGAFMGLPAFIPYFRRRLRESDVSRQWMARMLGILTTITVYAIGAFVIGSNTLVSFEEVFSEEEQRVVIQQVNITGGETEAWLRHLLPPFLRGACLTGDADICQQLDDLTPESTWLDYLSLLLGAGISGGVCYWLVRRSHRPLWGKRRRR